MLTSMNRDELARNGPAKVVTRCEVIVILIFFVAFFVVNISTATLYPAVWLDEVMFLDPAANLFLGKGFQTTTWPHLHREAFFAGYPPLYSIVLAGWMNVTELNPTGVRALNYILIILAATMIWWVVVRGNWISAMWHRVMLVALVLLGYGVSMGYRSGRPDTLMVLLVVGIWLAFTIRRTALRYMMLMIISSAMPLTGLQLLPFTMILLALLLVFVGRQYSKELLTVFLGVCVGCGLLVSIYLANGVFGDFLVSIRGDTSTGLLGALLGRGAFHHENKLPKDFSLFVLVAAGVWLLIIQGRNKSFYWRSPLCFGLAGAFLIPLAIVSTGKFPTYYAWMAYLPLAVCVVIALSSASGSFRGRSIVVALMIAACLVGLPFQLAFACYDREDRRYEPVEELAAAHIVKDDWVFCDYGAYYAVKNRAEMVFVMNSRKKLSESAEDRQRITVMIVDPSSAEKVQTVIGGKWYRVGTEIKPTRGMLTEELFGISIPFGIFQTKYNLQVYRRSPLSTVP